MKKAPNFSFPDEVITFLVGKREDPFKFTVHKEFTCYHSPVLQAALTGNHFVEGQTQTYRIEDATEGAFRLLVHWLYLQKLDIQQLPTDFKWDTQAKLDLSREEDQHLVELWVLADTYQILLLQNEALRTIVKIGATCEMIATRCLGYVHENTASESALRRYYVAECSLYLEAGVLRDFPEKILREGGGGGFREHYH